MTINVTETQPLTFDALTEWRKTFKPVAKSFGFKKVAREFKAQFALDHLKGWEILELLRAPLSEEYFKLFDRARSKVN